MPEGRRYLLISPCRDEARHMRRTLETVAAQTVPPALWIVVDDGSSDGTPEILREFAEKLPYLRVVRREDRGRRAVGPGVIEAFYHGLATARLEDFDYLCKLDMDLDLPASYFESLMRRMEEEPRLGTTSGKAWFIHPESGQLRPETMGDDNSAGMTKFYRVSCFQEIGGFVREVMWDGIDCHRCRMLGWIAESREDRELRFVHLRPEGSSDRGVWTGRARAGFGQYFMGTSPLYYLASCTYRFLKYPYVIGSLAMMWGYVSSALRRKPRYEDLEFRAFLRRWQMLCLTRGKRRAMEIVGAEREPLWNERHGPRPQVAKLASV